jgi:leader peptidase (prepilin peptidase)/N-methyltransferase
MDTIRFLADNSNVFLVIIAVISLFIGSFLNVLIYRLPLIIEYNWHEECRMYLRLKPHAENEKLNLCLPMSHCPRCKNPIRPWHNIPLVSYLWLHGKCAHCKGHISIRYPLVEAFTCIASVYTAWRFGFSWQTLAALIFTWISITLIFIDLEYHLLPDHLTLSLLWTGLFCSIFSIFANSHDAIIGAIAGYFIFAFTQRIFYWATGKIGMGQGDFKYLAALGAFFGWQMLPFIILFASISGVIFTLTHMAIKRNFKSTPLPFGPYLAVAGWIALVWGQEILHYYLPAI